MKSIVPYKPGDPGPLIIEGHPIPNPGEGPVFNSPDIRAENNYFQKFVNNLETGNFSLPVKRVYRPKDVTDTHRSMENNDRIGKIVVTTKNHVE